MTTRTHPRTGLTKWEKITMISIAAFVIGVAGDIALGIIDTGWTSWIQLALFLIAIIAMIMAIIGAVKVWGGLKTGITTLIFGAVSYVVGRSLVHSAGTSNFLGVELPNFSDPSYIIGSPLHTYGVVFLIIGGIMAIVTYLRRVLKAVESKN